MVHINLNQIPKAEQQAISTSPTTAVTDNSTAEGLINKTMTPSRAKTYDQRTNWLKCREAQKQFNIIWKSGRLNRADYHSKTHPIQVYKNKRHDYVAAAA